MAATTPSRAARISSRVYRRLLIVYPRAFRASYGREMALTFRDQCRDALQARGLAGLAALWLRVLLDLLRSAPAEHLASLDKSRAFFARGQLTFQTEGGNMDTQLSTAPDRQSGGWREALLAALPMLVIGFFFILPGAIYQNTPDTTGRALFRIVFLVSLGLGLLAALVVAWRKRFPAWSASWMVIWLLLAVVLPIAYLQDILLQQSGLMLYLTMPLFLIATGYLLYRLARRDLILSVVAVVPLVVLMGWITHEFVYPQFNLIVQLAAFLAAAAIAFDAVRSGNWKRALLLSVGGAVLLSAAEAYGAEFLIRNVPQVQRIWREFLVSFAALALPRVALLAGPALAVGIRALGLRSGPRGGLAYRLALLGVLLPIVSLMVEASIGSTGDYYASSLLARNTLTAMLIGGAILFLVGWALIVWGLYQQKITPPWQTALLVIIPVLLPYALAAYAKSVGISVAIFRGMAWSTVYVYCAIGFAWAAASVWAALQQEKA
jgi:hypothetical protein